MINYYVSTLSCHRIEQVNVRVVPPVRKRRQILLSSQFFNENYFLIPIRYSYTNTAYLNLNDTAKMNPC